MEIYFLSKYAIAETLQHSISGSVILQIVGNSCVIGSSVPIFFHLKAELNV